MGNVIAKLVLYILRGILDFLFGNMATKINLKQERLHYFKRYSGNEVEKGGNE